MTVVKPKPKQSNLANHSKRNNVMNQSERSQTATDAKRGKTRVNELTTGFGSIPDLLEKQYVGCDWLEHIIARFFLANQRANGQTQYQ